MRLVPALLVALTACASGPRPLRPADPGQAVPGEPRAGTASAAGVRLTVRPAESSGWDVDERLTPIDVVIDNRGDRTLELRPERFVVALPDGRRVPALTREELRARFGPSLRGVSDNWEVYRASPPGMVYFPPGGLPASWGGIMPAWSLPPAAALGRETVARGEATEVLLLFGVPAASVTTFELEAELVDAAGERVGTIRVPFERGAPRPDFVPVPPIADPPKAG